jgi:hypothetical protein
MYFFGGALLLTWLFTTGVLFVEVEGHRASVSRRAAGALCFGLCLLLIAFGVHVMITTK